MPVVIPAATPAQTHRRRGHLRRAYHSAGLARPGLFERWRWLAAIEAGVLTA